MDRAWDVVEYYTTQTIQDLLCLPLRNKVVQKDSWKYRLFWSFELPGLPENSLFRE